MKNTLYTIGYSRWAPAARLKGLLEMLQAHDVSLLVDTRLQPCSSQLTGRYGPKDWTLQSGAAGLAHHLGRIGVEYLWLSELGNPQRHDPDMAVLRAHLEDGGMRWPVNRGLELLRGRIEGDDVVCLLCTCRDAATCHRTVIGEAVRARYFGERLDVRSLT